MPTNKFQKAQIENFEAQATIKVNSPQSWVTITDKNDAENTVFLQGHEADQFIEQAHKMYRKNKDIGLDAAYSFFGYEYLDVLFHG